MDTMELAYTRVGDYLLPNLTLNDPLGAPPLGRYALRRRAYLREHRPILYNQLLLSEQLYPHLREIDEAAELWRKLGASDESILAELVYD